MPSEEYNIDFVLVREMAKVFAEETHECEKMRGLMNTTKDEEQKEHRWTLHDNLTRLQDKIGKLWLYVSGSNDFEVLVRDQLSKATAEIIKPTENVVENTNTDEQSS
jgi:hypothetical protein